MSTEPELPPTGEQIHMPEPSLLPLLLTIGITVLLIGVTGSPILLVSGTVLTVIVLARWIVDARREYRHLPAHHGDGH